MQQGMSGGMLFHCNMQASKYKQAVTAHPSEFMSSGAVLR